jgi:hypothetical protein
MMAAMPVSGREDIVGQRVDVSGGNGIMETL